MCTGRDVEACSCNEEGLFKNALLSRICAEQLRFGEGALNRFFQAKNK
jgi:hypothetical protein